MVLGRSEEAERALGAYIVDEPDDPLALSWLALVASNLDKLDDASRHAQRAIEVAPDFSLAWYALGQVWLRRRELPKAEDAAREAIRLAPDDADGFGLLAQVQVQRKQWSEALETADAGLSVDPEDDACTNLKAMALRGLGRKAESADALEGQLARTPEDSTTHANLGWTCLDRGDYERAREHFREALRLNPNSEWARAGIVEALKARHWFFRPVLRYFLWMGKLQAKWQVAILIGGWLVYRAAASVAESGAPFASLLWGVVGAYVVFVVLTWFANPILHGLLVFHPFGRLALSLRQKLQGLLVTSLLCVAIGLGVAGILQSGVLFVAGVALAILCLPLSMVFDLEARKARMGMSAYTGAMALMALWWVVSFGSASALATKLDPMITEIRALVTERDEVERERRRLLDQSEQDSRDAVSKARIEAFKARSDELDARSQALEQKLNSGGSSEEFKQLEQQHGFNRTLALVYSILGFWVSQIVAAALSRKYGV